MRARFLESYPISAVAYTSNSWRRARRFTRPMAWPGSRSREHCRLSVCRGYLGYKYGSLRTDCISDLSQRARISAPTRRRRRVSSSFLLAVSHEKQIPVAVPTVRRLVSSLRLQHHVPVEQRSGKGRGQRAPPVRE
jgi:hypothetical protein